MNLNVTKGTEWSLWEGHNFSLVAEEEPEKDTIKCGQRYEGSVTEREKDFRKGKL